MSPGRSQFKDHFSGHAREYAIYRPSYPESLYEWLGQMPGGKLVAWDCATGNGQAAVGLASHFQCVFASDASSKQIRQAIHHPRISYRVEAAESSSLTDESVDLLTVGQAYHWFDHLAFLLEANRVLRPGGVLAIWTYKLAKIEPAIDAIVCRFYKDIVGDYWPPERKFIDRDYQDFNLPWPEIAVPDFTMSATWTLEELIGYLGTWSAFRRYVQDKKSNPLEIISDELLDAWGDPGQGKQVTWPLVIRVCGKPD